MCGAPTRHNSRICPVGAARLQQGTVRGEKLVRVTTEQALERRGIRPSSLPPPRLVAARNELTARAESWAHGARARDVGGLRAAVGPVRGLVRERGAGAAGGPLSVARFLADLAPRWRPATPADPPSAVVAGQLREREGMRPEPQSIETVRTAAGPVEPGVSRPPPAAGPPLIAGTGASRAAAVVTPTSAVSSAQRPQQAGGESPTDRHADRRDTDDTRAPPVRAAAVSAFTGILDLVGACTTISSTCGYGRPAA